MSVDYESVLIYGYKISKSEIKRLEEETGKFIEEFCDKYDGTDKYSFITDNAYGNYGDYYFGVTLGREIDLDSIDAICWFEYETDAIDKEFENAFGDMSFADTHHPMMYHFVRVC